MKIIRKMMTVNSNLATSAAQLNYLGLVHSPIYCRALVLFSP